jgi:hypothetical protein
LTRDCPMRQDQEFTIGGTHVAWSTQRYMDLFSVGLRKSNDAYKNCAFTCGYPGPGSQKDITCVVWEPRYMNVDNWDDPEAIYVYQTTSKKWKAYVLLKMIKN